MTIAARLGTAQMPSLGDLVAGRDNNIQLLRLCAATAVLVFHCFALTDHWTEEPLWRFAPELNLGALGVRMFFFVSGLLVTQSFLRRPHVTTFAAARALRIYPALVAATLFSVALGSASSTLTAAQFWRHAQTLDYLVRTALGFDVGESLPGAYAGNPRPFAANGSLYTLPYELRLYLAVLAAGACGLLTRRYALLAIVATAVAAAIAWPQWPNRVFAYGTNEHVDVLVLMFALGALAYAWRDEILVSRAGALAALGLIAVDPAGLARGPLFAPLLAYAMLTVAYHPALRWQAFNRLGDYSYGVYVYAFPIQQTLIERIPGIAPGRLFLLAFPLTLAVAVLSWHAIERPALGLKSAFRRSKASP